MEQTLQQTRLMAAICEPSSDWTEVDYVHLPDRQSGSEDYYVRANRVALIYFRTQRSTSRDLGADTEFAGYGRAMSNEAEDTVTNAATISSVVFIRQPFGESQYILPPSF